MPDVSSTISRGIGPRFGGGVRFAVRRGSQHPPVTAAGLWAFGYVTLSITGQPYSLRVLYAGWQQLPEPLLRDDPLGSVWHLHIQPPVWNLLTGAVDAWSPLGLGPTHRAISLMVGALLAAAICSTLRHLGASPAVAIALAALATLNTQVLRHAFEPQYDLATTALVAGLVWSVARPRTDGGPCWLHRCWRPHSC